MKKKIAILVVVMLMVSVLSVGILGGKSHARSAQLFLEVPDSIKKEEQFQVHVVLESDVNLYSIDAYLKYDDSKFEFVAENDVITGSAGMLEIKDVYPEETKKKEYDITFKALETGESEMSLSEVYLIDYADMDYIEINPTSQVIDVKMNRSEDMDVRLASLLVAPGELQEEFTSEVFEYEMHVGLDVEQIGVSATPLEESSIVESDIPEKLQEGENVVTIKVTALSGNVGIYTIHVFREEIVEDTEEEISEEAMDDEDTEEATEVEDATTTEAEAVTTESIEEEVTTETVNEEVTEETTETEEEIETEEKADSNSEAE